MAKLTYTDNGITFGDIKTIGHAIGSFAGKANYTVNGSNANSLKGGEIDTAIPSFNAIDIDWNGAKLKGFANVNDSTTTDVTINTTGELLQYIEKAYYQAYTGTGNSSESISYNQISLNGLYITDENSDRQSLQTVDDLVNYTEKALQYAYFSQNISYNFNFLFSPRVFSRGGSYVLLDTSNDTQLITGSTFMDKEKISITESNRQYYDEKTQQWEDLTVLKVNVVENGSKTDIQIYDQVFDLRIIDLNDPLLGSEYFATSDLQLLYCKGTAELVNGEIIGKEVTYYADSINDDSKLSNKFQLNQGVGLIEHKAQDIFIGSLDTTNFPAKNYPTTVKQIDDLGTKILATSISYYSSVNSSKFLEIASPVNEIKNLEVSLTGEGVVKIYKGNRYVNKVDSQTPIHSIPFSITLNTGKISVATPNTSNTPSSQDKTIEVTWPVTNAISGNLEYVTEVVTVPFTNDYNTLISSFQNVYGQKYNGRLDFNYTDVIFRGIVKNDDGSLAYIKEPYGIKFVNSALESTNDSTTTPQPTSPSEVKKIKIIWTITDSMGNPMYAEEYVGTSSDFNSLMMSLNSLYDYKYGGQIMYDEIIYEGITNNNGSLVYYGDTYTIKFVNSALESTNDSTTTPQPTSPATLPDTTVVPDATVPTAIPS